MATDTIVNAVKAMMDAEFNDLAVELYPPNLADYRLNHPTGALLIAVPAVAYGDHLLMGSGGSQRRTLTLGITLATRQMWGPLGAIELLDRLRACLGGQLPTADAESPLICTGERLAGEQAGIWYHTATYTTVYRETLDGTIL